MKAAKKLRIRVDVLIIGGNDGFCQSQLIIQAEKPEKSLKENALDRPVTTNESNDSGSWYYEKDLVSVGLFNQ